jgi:glycosyltransferase involved in cell wall biosynthesis
VPQKQTILLSVIFPVLNASEDIEGVFYSVASQINIDKSAIEIIVVDDGSSDDTVQKVLDNQAVFEGFADFQLLRHKKLLGLAQTRHDGAEAAKGKYLTFVDKRTRPDPDYLQNLLNKNHDFVVGNIYMDKHASIWDRLLVLIRKKLYHPYFNHPFKDVLLDFEAYRKFKNKGGGGAMLVLRRDYLQASKNIRRSVNVNDDSMLIENLTKHTPLLKTSTAKAKYLNRTGFWENVRHLFNRGPKFVDYYIKPGTRFFPLIMLLLAILATNLALVFIEPKFLFYELTGFLVVLVMVCFYLAEDFGDFFICLFLLPLALICFSAGIIKGFLLKLLRRY